MSDTRPETLPNVDSVKPKRQMAMNRGFVLSGGEFPFNRGACRAIGGSCVYREGLQPHNWMHTCPENLQSRWECLLSFLAQRLIRHTRPWERDADLTNVAVAPDRMNADQYDRLCEAVLSFVKANLSDFTMNDSDKDAIASAAKEREKRVHRPRGRREALDILAKHGPYTGRPDRGRGRPRSDASGDGSTSDKTQTQPSWPKAERAYADRTGVIDFLYGLLCNARSADQSAIRALFQGQNSNRYLGYDSRIRAWELLLRMDAADRTSISGEVDRLHALYAKTTTLETESTAVLPLGPHPERKALWSRLGDIERMRLAQQRKASQAPASLPPPPPPPTVTPKVDATLKFIG